MKRFLDALNRHPQWKSVLGVIAVVVVISLLGFRADRATVGIAVEGENFIVRYSDQFEFRFSKEDVISTRLVEDPDYGTPVQAVSQKTYLAGRWENEEYGTYDLAVKESARICIIVQTGDGFCAYNYNSKAQTEAAYEALVDWIEAE